MSICTHFDPFHKDNYALIMSTHFLQQHHRFCEDEAFWRWNIVIKKLCFCKHIVWLNVLCFLFSTQSSFMMEWSLLSLLCVYNVLAGEEYYCRNVNCFSMFLPFVSYKTFAFVSSFRRHFSVAQKKLISWLVM